MKEYINKTTGEYRKTSEVVSGEQWVGIPDGAEKATLCNDFIIFWKEEKYSFSIDEECKWCYKVNSDSIYYDFDEYMNTYGDAVVLWQRHAQPEALPFMDDEPSLNDQYAEIEKVRQTTVADTLAARQATYGSFEDVAFVTEGIMDLIARVRPNGLKDIPTPHRMSLYMIASKIARLANGDIGHKDSWHDIGGYAKLIEDLID